MTAAREMGERAVPALIDSLENPELRLQSIQILGDLGAKEAVPKLISSLTLEGNLNDGLILRALGEITGETGFHRFYYEAATRQAAFDRYTARWQEELNIGRRCAESGIEYE